VDYQAILGLGIFFIVFGLASLFWDRRERNAYYNSQLTKKDVKEFITHEPERRWLNAWRIGGRISLILGILLIIAAGVLRLISP